MYTDLKADELSWFASKFMLDFAKTSIAIENFSNEAYPRFYAGFLDIFKDFLNHRMSFDISGTLNVSYDDFSNMIKGYVPVAPQEGATASLNNIPASGAICIDQLKELRKLEER